MKLLRDEEQWAKLDHAVIVAAIRQWHHNLSACVKAGGVHVEYSFWPNIALIATFVTHGDNSIIYALLDLSVLFWNVSHFGVIIYSVQQ